MAAALSEESRGRNESVAMALGCPAQMRPQLVEVRGWHVTFSYSGHNYPNQPQRSIAVANYSQGSVTEIAGQPLNVLFDLHAEHSRSAE